MWTVTPACHLRRRWRRWRSAGVWAGAAGPCRRWGWAGSPSLVLCLHRHQHRSAIEVTITARTCWLTHNTHVHSCLILQIRSPFIFLLMTFPFPYYSVSTKAGQSTTPNLLSALGLRNGAETADCSSGRLHTSDKCPPDTWTGDWGPLLTLVLGLRTLHHCTSPCTDCTQPGG